MQIYIEYLLIDNLTINSIIIYLTCKLINYKIKFKKLILISLFATSLSFVFPFIANVNFFLLIFIKLIAGLAIVLLIKKFKKLKEVLICYLIFISSTFLFGGMCYGVLCFFNVKTSVNGVLLNSFEVPVGLIILCVLVYSFFVFKLVNFCKKKNQFSSYNYDVIISANGKEYNIQGYLDTGNMVYDNYLKKPVLIISYELYEKIINSFNLKNTLKYTMVNCLRYPHYINIETVSSKDKIFAFEIDYIKVYYKNRVYKNTDVVVGVSKSKFKDFDCILHKELMSA